MGGLVANWAVCRMTSTGFGFSVTGIARSVSAYYSGEFHFGLMALPRGIL